MVIALNPKKIRQFTTKGIHLTLLKPVTSVPVGLEQEFLDKITKAITDGDLINLPDNESVGYFVPGIGSSTGIEENENHKGQLVSEVSSDNGEEIDIKDPFGNTIHAKRMTITLKISEPEEPESKPIIIL